MVLPILKWYPNFTEAKSLLLLAYLGCSSFSLFFVSKITRWNCPLCLLSLFCWLPLMMKLYSVCILVLVSPTTKSLERETPASPWLWLLHLLYCLSNLDLQPILSFWNLTLNLQLLSGCLLQKVFFQLDMSHTKLLNFVFRIFCYSVYILSPLSTGGLLFWCFLSTSNLL